jgi:subtilisin family serine protease
MMRNKLISCVISIALLLSGMAFAQSPRDTATSKIDPDLTVKIERMKANDLQRVIVRYKIPRERRAAMQRGAPDTERRAAVDAGRTALFDSTEFQSISAQRRGAKPPGLLRYSPYIAFEGTKAEIDTLSRSPLVEIIYENRETEAHLPESTGTSFVDATTTRSLGFKGSGQTIAIVDVGVAQSHSHFGQGRFVAEACFVDDNDCIIPGGGIRGPGEAGLSGEPLPGVTHGTSVAAVAASSDATYAGVAPQANLIAVRVFTNNPYSTFSNFFNLTEALEWIYDQRNLYDIAAVNLSLGNTGSFQSGGLCDSFDPGLTASISNLINADIAVIASTGNDQFTTGIRAPACISGVVSVGATGDGSGIATFDGVEAYSNSACNVDLLAPGSDIFAAETPPNAISVLALRGTSFAAPHVSGAFAVLKSAVPTATSADILAALKATGKPITDARNGVTKPRIDVYEALQWLQSPPPPAPPTFTVVPLNGFTLIPNGAAASC